MGTYLKEQLTCVEQLLKGAKEERDKIIGTHGSDIREICALNDKVDRLKEQLRKCQDVVNAEINSSSAIEALVDMAGTEIGKYLADRGFREIDGLRDLCDGDWVANLVGEKDALIFSIPIVKIEGAGKYDVTHIYWSWEDHEHKTDISWYDSYKKVDGDKDNCFCFSPRLEDLLVPFRPDTDPVIFDPCGLEYNSDSGICVYKLDMCDIQVKVSAWNAPYTRCLRHEKTDIQKLLINKS